MSLGQTASNVLQTRLNLSTNTLLRKTGQLETLKSNAQRNRAWMEVSDGRREQTQGVQA